MTHFPGDDGRYWVKKHWKNPQNSQNQSKLMSNSCARSAHSGLRQCRPNFVLEDIADTSVSLYGIISTRGITENGILAQVEIRLFDLQIYSAARGKRSCSVSESCHSAVGSLYEFLAYKRQFFTRSTNTANSAYVGVRTNHDIVA